MFRFSQYASTSSGDPSPPSRTTSCGSTTIVDVRTAPSLCVRADRWIGTFVLGWEHGVFRWIQIAIATPAVGPYPAFSNPPAVRFTPDPEELGAYRDLTAEAGQLRYTVNAPSTASFVPSEDYATPWLDVARQSREAGVEENAMCARLAIVYGQDEVLPSWSIPAPK